MIKIKKKLSLILVLMLTLNLFTPLSMASENTPSISDLTKIEKPNTKQKYSLSGIVSTNPTSTGFYISERGTNKCILFYDKNKKAGKLNVSMGDSIDFTAKLDAYGGQPQITTIEILKVSTDAIQQQYTKKSIKDLTDEDNSTFIEIENVKVDNITNDKGNFKFDISSDSDKLTVYVDKNIGISYSDVIGKNARLHQDDIINVKGVYKKHFKNYQLNLVDKSGFTVVKESGKIIEEKQPEKATISQIQGETHQSTYADKTVEIENVVVTKVIDKKNFYIQSITPDNNSNTSEGLAVYNNTDTTVKEGEKLTIVGKITEYVDSKNKETDLTITQIVPEKITKNGTAKIPDAIVIGKDVKIPTNSIDSDSFGKFNPDVDAIDFWESLEGMLVKVEQPKIVAPQKYGELHVVPKDFDKLNAGLGLTITEKSFNLNDICLLVKGNGANKIKAKQSDRLSDDVIGAVSYNFSKYVVVVNKKELPEIIESDYQRETTSLVPDENKLLIASYNIENFSANKETVTTKENKKEKGTSDEKVEVIAKSIVNDLKNPDIISVIEMQDNSGMYDDGVTDATESAKRLSSTIEKAGGVHYEYTDIAPLDNVDGGAPGGNIRLGFFYNPLRVSLKDAKKGDATTAVSYENKALTLNPGRIDPLNNAFENTRKSLAGQFVFKGNDVIILSNHLSSKRGDMPLFGKVQPPVFASEAHKMNQVSVLKKFVDDVIAKNPDANVVLTGDFNDFEFSKPLKYMVEDGKLVNLVSNYEESRRFAYSYNGVNQCLDQLLVSKNIEDTSKFDIVHVNSMFMEEHGRASDHDPLLVQLDFSKKMIKEEKPNTNTSTISSSGGGSSRRSTSSINNETKIADAQKQPTVEKNSEMSKDITVKSPTLSDIKTTDWYYASVQKMLEKEIFVGYQDNTFRPNSNMNRAQMATVLVKIYNKDKNIQTKTNFKDVKSNAWYKNSVEKCISAGIMTGTSTETFEPNRDITRVESIVALYNVIEKEDISENEISEILSKFGDANSVPKWARKATAVLIKQGIINGENGKINPMNKVTRAQVSQMLSKMI